MTETAVRRSKGASPICPSHAITEVGRAWIESWAEQPEAVQRAIDFCPYCREENERVFRRQLRIAVLILAALALTFAYNWMVGLWRSEVTGGSNERS